MGMTDRQAPKELEVFRAFAQVCDLCITPDSIEKRCPPEPDILCALYAGGCVAFEMVQLIDKEKIGRRLADKESLDRYFEETYQDLPKELRDRIPKARISVKMRPSAMLSSRRNAVSKIIDQLLLVDSEFGGNLLLPPNLKRIASVQVGRRSRLRPLFDVEAPSLYKGVPLDAISKKFEKSYATSFPAELLAYYDAQAAPPESELKPLYSCIDSWVAKSCFRRAWVFDFRKQRVVYQTMLKGSVTT